MIGLHGDNFVRQPMVTKAQVLIEPVRRGPLFAPPTSFQKCIWNRNRSVSCLGIVPSLVGSLQCFPVPIEEGFQGNRSIFGARCAKCEEQIASLLTVTLGDAEYIAAGDAESRRFGYTRVNAARNSLCVGKQRGKIKPTCWNSAILYCCQ